MAKRNPVKDFLESSPWALGGIAFAAVASFLLTLADGGWRIYDRIKATSEVPTIEVARFGAFVLAPVTPAMQEDPHVRAVQGFSRILRDSDPSRVPLWPVQLLVLNPTKDTINLHSCRLRISLPVGVYTGVKTLGNIPLESSEYFFSDAIASVEARAAGKPIAIAAGEAKRVQLYFLFALLDHLREKGKEEDAFTSFRPPVTAVVTCRDQARRELSATSTIYGTILPESQRQPAADAKPPRKTP
jgi:hypothetical protein